MTKRQIATYLSRGGVERKQGGEAKCCGQMRESEVSAIEWELDLGGSVESDARNLYAKYHRVHHFCLRHTSLFVNIADNEIKAFRQRW